MGTKGEGNRRRIIEAADDLFYQHGYRQTSFQDIAEATGIPRGNFYYYFKTKDDILAAVISSRMDEVRAFIQQCESSSEEALERLLAFTRIMDANRENIVRSGCPLGTLDAELAKDEPALHEQSRQVFSLLRDWLGRQFAALGLEKHDELALDMLARMQGVTIMACTFRDEAFVLRSMHELQDWLKHKTLS